MPSVPWPDGWRPMILQPCLRWLRPEGSRKCPNRWKWSDKLPHSPLSRGTSGLNPWTFFELAHLFRVSLTNQSADFCLGLNVAKLRRVPSFRLWKGLSVWNRRHSVTLTWPVVDGLGCLAFPLAGSCNFISQLSRALVWSGFTSVSSVMHWIFTLSDYSVTLVVILWVNGGFHLQLCWRCE